MARKTLTNKQKQFVQEYLVDLNATQAAIRAGYSEKTAYSLGQENLKKPEIAAAISVAQKAREERTEITQDYVLRGLKREAEFTGKGSTPSARVQALTQLGKHLGMFVSRVQLEGEQGAPPELLVRLFASDEYRNLICALPVVADREQHASAQSGDAGQVGPTPPLADAETHSTPRRSDSEGGGGQDEAGGGLNATATRQE